MSAAFFDGTGGTYFTRTTPLACTTAYPFWVSMWVMPQRYPGGNPNPYTLWASAKADMSNGNWGMMWGQVLYSGLLQAWTANGSTSNKAESDECIIAFPYWNHCLMEFRSATDRRVYLNGTRDIGGTNATNLSFNISSGSPVTRIGIDAAGLKPFWGNIAGVAFGTGLLNDTDRNLLANSDHFTGLPTLTAGTITNYFELDGNGNDSVGSENLTAVGTVVYDTGYPDHTNYNSMRSDNPSRLDVVQFIHKVNHLHTESPTVVAGQTPPISTSGWTNLASVERFDITFTVANAQTGGCRGYHFIPTVGSQDHCVFINNGHAGFANWDSYDTSLMIKCLIRDGFGVYGYTMPAFDPSGSGGSDFGVYSIGHDSWTTPSGTDPHVSNTFNVIEVFMAPIEIAMNNLVSRYSKRSHIGLSGGGWTVAHICAMDDRFNYAVLPDRGTIPDRRYPPPPDMEQRAYPNGWKVEEYYALCGVGNRRFWLTTHTVDFGSWTGSRNDLDSTNFDTKFMAPIRAANPFADVQFKLDTGAGTSSTHKFYQSTYDDIFYPALTTALPTIYDADLLTGGTYYQPQAFTHDLSGWADDIILSGNVTAAIQLSAALSEASDIASISAFATAGRHISAALADANDVSALFAFIGSGSHISGSLAEANDVANIVVNASSDAVLSGDLIERADRMTVGASTGSTVIQRRHRIRGTIAESALAGAD